MGTLKRIGIALIIGAALVLALVCVAAALIMSGTLFVGREYPSRAAMTQLPEPAADPRSGDPVDPETRSRLNSIYPVAVGLPSIVIALLHYL